jgi:flagellar hook protein FlgE
VPIQLPTAGIAPVPSSRVDIEMNLDTRLAVTAPASGPAIDFQDPATFNNATSINVYDAKGQDVALTFYFQKAATDQWNVFVTANGASVLGTNAAPAPVTTITYASDGGAPIAPPGGSINFDVPASVNGVGAQTLPITGLLFEFGSSTQFGSPFGVTDMSQDGSTAGLLTSIVVEPDGTVTARYSNGESKAAARLELATFRNPQGLQPLGDNRWGATIAAGDPVLGSPGVGSLGVLQSGALEESNVDLTDELVSMITAQRVYQANAQTIKTMDQVLQTLVNLR